MEIFEFISMLFPFFMVLLFISISLKKYLKSRKSSKNPPVNAVPEASEKKKRPWLDRFPDIAPMMSGQPPPAESAAPEETAPQEPPAPPKPAADRVKPSSSAGLHILESSVKPSAKFGQSEPEPGRKRIAGLPELKKAVIWSEILGKPKGLE